MRRDPQRLADVGANATPEDRLLASLIEHHRAARPTAAGLRGITRRVEALAPPSPGAGRLNGVARFGAAAAACVAVAVIGLRVTSLSTAPSPPQSSASFAGARSEPSDPASAAAAPSPSGATTSAHDAVPVDALPSEPASAEGRPPEPPTKAAAVPPTRRASVTRTKRSCDESELIDRAETLLRTGQAAGALEATRLHAACDETVLDQERERIAVEALVLLGRHQEATTRARAFEASYPSSPHLRRIRQLVGLGAE